MVANGRAEAQADAYERAHPSTRLPFIRCKVTIRGEGSDAQAVCKAVDEAREAGKPLLLYFGRSHFAPKDKKGKKESKMARKFEKGVLNSKTAQKECAGWALLRFDLADGNHRAYARSLQVETAPTLLLWAPGAEAPAVLDRRITGHGLAFVMKKHRAD